jgi:predicted component of type VI protein secretion system
MKITKAQLKEIIKKEISSLLNESNESALNDLSMDVNAEAQTIIDEIQKKIEASSVDKVLLAQTIANALMGYGQQ